MVISVCQHDSTKKHGKDRNGNQRFRCNLCGKTFVEDTPKPLGDMRIGMKAACQALAMLLEGMSIRATERITGLHRDTICDLILTVGENCQRFLDSAIVGVEVSDVQADEIWSFVGCKEKTRIARQRDESMGDSWTFIAIERNTKLILAHTVGDRDSATTCQFLRKVNRATSGQFQMSTDGLSTYTNNVPFEFGSRVDFGQLIKNFQSSQNVTRYSPAKIISSQKKAVYGNPDQNLVCTSHIERLNLTVRMNNRRFTRLTNAHGKSLSHHTAMQAIFVA